MPVPSIDATLFPSTPPPVNQDDIDAAQSHIELKIKAVDDRDYLIVCRPYHEKPYTFEYYIKCNVCMLQRGYPGATRLLGDEHIKMITDHKCVVPWKEQRNKILKAMGKDVPED